VSDLTDDLIAEFLNPHPEPRLPRVGVSVSKRVTPKSAPEPVSDVPLDLTYKLVTPRKVLPLCMACQRKLASGEHHWYYRDPSSLYWWCHRCMRLHCNLTPPKERSRERSHT